MRNRVSNWVSNRMSQWLRMMSHLVSNISIMDWLYQVGLFIMMSKGLVFKGKRWIFIMEGSEVFMRRDSWCLVKYMQRCVVDRMMSGS